MEFRCRLGTPGGEIIEGVYVADSESRLRSELEEKGLFVLSLQRRGAFPGLTPGAVRRRRISSQEFLVFNQELATNQEIAQFCKLTYFVEFPMIEKASVAGTGANPFFKQLAAATGESPQWNFHKYLIAPDGKTVYSFATGVEPDAREIMSKLTPMLK